MLFVLILSEFFFPGLEENWKEPQQFVVDAQGKVVFKSLFISDSDKRKHFAINIKVNNE